MPHYLGSDAADFLTVPLAAQDTDRDFFMGAEEATEYGLIDAVISRPQLIAATNGASP